MKLTFRNMVEQDEVSYTNETPLQKGEKKVK